MSKKKTKIKIRISVRDLVEFTQRTGDLAYGMDTLPDTVKSIRAHQRYQYSRDEENYESEVSLSHTVHNEEMDLLIRGRVDGIFEDDGSTVVEEIKTVKGDPQVAAERENPLHWGQVKTYAYIYAVDYSLTTIDARLMYCQLDTNATHHSRRQFTIEELRDFFNDMTRRYLDWIATVHAHRKRRDESAKMLPFPFADFRVGQRQLAAYIYQTIRNKDDLLAQAPTGIGKTIAALFATIKAIGEKETEKLFYLSARNTGQIQVESMLRILRKTGLIFKTVRLTRRLNLCPTGETDCSAPECPYAKGFYDRLYDAMMETFEDRLIEADDWKEVVEKHLVCPHPLLIELSAWVDGVICDYNYVFDPNTTLRELFENRRHNYTLLLDEAHNLVSRAREMYSSRIYKSAILSARRLVGKAHTACYRDLTRINKWMLDRMKDIDSSGSQIDPRPPEKLIELLTQFVLNTKDLLSSGIHGFRSLELVDLFFEIITFLQLSETADDDYTVIYKKQDDDLEIHLFCINPSNQLIKAKRRVKSAIFFSATLSPFSYFSDLYGCSESSQNLALPSPFPTENQVTLVASQISTRYQHRRNTASRVVEILKQFQSGNRGNVLFFFPSYAYMDYIFQLYEKLDYDGSIIKQQPEMNDVERQGFLNAFQTYDEDSNLAGFAVMGGVFGEGIDLKGSTLTGAAIVSVGLPGISLEGDIVRDYFNGKNDAGYNYAYLYPGITRVLQAAGRVIRSEEDRGVILLIDDRFNQKSYRSLLPAQWSPIPFRDTSEFMSRITRFWNSHEESNKAPDLSRS